MSGHCKLETNKCSANIARIVGRNGQNLRKLVGPEPMEVRYASLP